MSSAALASRRPAATASAAAAATATPAPEIPRARPPSASVPALRGELDVELLLRHAGPHRVRLRWETQGEPTLPAVVVLGGISATRHAGASAVDAEPGWWQEQVGPGRALDPARRRLIGLDWLGADGALDVPIDTADQADAVAAVLDALGVARLAAFVGSSYGAMVGLAFAARYPARLARLVAISGAHRPHPFASAWRGLQRKIVALGLDHGAADEALSLARQLAMLSYRTPEELAARFDAPVRLTGQRARAASDDYLEACGARYVARWSPAAFLRLSESIDLHAVDPARIVTPTTLVGVAEDRLVPLSDLRTLASALAGRCRLHELSSAYGHDAFLKEPAAIAAILRAPGGAPRAGRDEWGGERSEQRGSSHEGAAERAQRASRPEGEL
ncbi:MAG TPA: homoserine O-succinyltransferase [Kofleriaceae bacterium]|nr:homoserine O-succinyltransferase [Kofleriaceae bacterium]